MTDEELHRGWLGAIALEQVLPASALTKLRLPGATPKGAERWLEATIATGEVLASGQGSSRLLGVIAPREQHVLRELAARGELRAIAAATRTVLAARSIGEVTIALAEGDLPELERCVELRRLPRPAAERSVAEWLVASVAETFDAAWFEATWARDAPEVAARILVELAQRPRHLPGDGLGGDLAGWARQRVARGPREHLERLASGLIDVAIAAGSAEEAEALLAPGGVTTSSASTLGRAALAAVVRGDARAAAQRLDDVRRRMSDPLRCGTMAPALAILLAQGRDAAGIAAARRCVLSAGSPDDRAAGRAFRAVLRALEAPEPDDRKLLVHRLPPGAPAWEVLLTGHAAHLALDEAVARASWAEHAASRGVLWRSAGAHWLAEQAVALADELDATVARRVLARYGDPTPASVGPSLWDLLPRAPEWTRTLRALAEVAAAERGTTEPALRIAWLIDPARPEEVRPALSELRPGSGWSRGERVSVARLIELEARLPEEDRAVLRHVRPAPGGAPRLAPEAHEALIGHPRVVDPTRAMAPLAVVRGACRVETTEVEGAIRIDVSRRFDGTGVHAVAEGEGLIAVHRVTDAYRKVMELLPRPLVIPRQHEAEVVAVLAELATCTDVSSPYLGAERDVVAESTPCLRIAPHAGAWAVQLGVRPFGERGRFFVAGTGRTSVTAERDGQRLRTVRDHVLERARVDRLLGACPSLRAAPPGPLEGGGAAPHPPEDGEGADDAWILGEEELLTLLGEVRDAGEPCELEWSGTTPLRLRGRVSTADLSLHLRSRKGWYLVTGSVRLDAVTAVSLAELVRAPFVARGRYVRLPGGDVVEVEARVRRVLAAIATASSRAGGELALHRGVACGLRALAEGALPIDLDRDGEAWLARVERAASATAAPPPGLRAVLRPYQLEGYRWLMRLAELGLGACLADDMGLGKTVQILAFLLAHAADGPALVVAPTSVCSNWIAEMRRFAPDLVPVELLGPDRAARLEALAAEGAGRVAITSYATLQNDVGRLAEIPWGTVVLDEAQLVKNAGSLRAQAVRRLGARRRIVATGTPVENRLGDLWSLFHFLEPGLLGPWEVFRRSFARPVEQDQDREAEAALRAIIRPQVLRRTKAEVLTDLPPLTEIRHDVHLSEGDALRYAFLRKQIHERLFTRHGKQGHKLEVLAAITRLRRFCCHPRLVFPDADAESAKIRVLLELVEELRDGGHRALVFSQYVDFLDLVREQLDERGITYQDLDGSTPQAERAGRVRDFQEGTATLFLISLKAGGFGLNLTAADYVIHLDPWWNPAVEAQAEGRAHRIGQERPVTVYRLVTRDTIEEDIVRLHHGKERLARELLDEDVGARLETADLVRLLGAQGSM